MSTVAVIDYGMGNLHSVAKALEHARENNEQIIVTPDPERILRADRVVFPGVGAIRDCVGELKRLGLDEVVREVARSKPLLGVCVGMQALMDFSEENGGTQCLGVLPGRVRYFGEDLTDTATGALLKVPHMGWNQVRQELQHPLWAGISQDSRFYFVHSYFVQSEDEALVAASSTHGLRFAAAMTRENVFAVQFHPEKSQHAGLRLYGNFLRWDGSA